MPAHVRTSRPVRAHEIIIRPPRAIPSARPVADEMLARRRVPREEPILMERAEYEPDPYIDYGRFLTPQGSIHIIYKDLDLRWWQTLWRIGVWLASTGWEAWYLTHNQLGASQGVVAVALVILALLNWLIVRKPVQIYRTVEICPASMVLDGSDLFWRRFMENGWPQFQPDEEGNQILSGIYGTRWVEFLTARRFDDNDRMAEVMEAHLLDAMQQLWTRNFH